MRMRERKKHVADIPMNNREKNTVNKIAGLTPDETLKLISKMAESWRSFHICQAALEKNPSCYEFIREEFKTPENTFKAVVANPDMIAHVPFYLKTKEICEIAAGHVWHSLQYIPENFRTEWICQKAIMTDHRHWNNAVAKGLMPGQRHASFRYVPIFPSNKLSLKEMKKLSNLVQLYDALDGQCEGFDHFVANVEANIRELSPNESIKNAAQLSEFKKEMRAFFKHVDSFSEAS
ncbi:hypothetical protein ACMXYX_18030 (plasmid) [Neptuniibacter sp. QD72_48]|uniref:hypothetical protein n=1 Tax=Neptuniibacter sp. QD72_48 TaxID=3398214 RepID=UPI0039F51158